MSKPAAVLIPKFILTQLQACMDAGVVPSIRQGEGGNSHSVWYIGFGLIDKRVQKYYGVSTSFEVKITSSYSQQFLDIVGHDGPGFDGFIEFTSIGAAVAAARKTLEVVEA